MSFEGQVEGWGGIKLCYYSHLLQKVESPPDGKVEEGEHNKG